MNKEIEILADIAKTIDKAEEFCCYFINHGCVGCEHNGLENCKIINAATALYNAGYRKIYSKE